MSKKTESKKIAFYTLGCKVNQYETQAIKEQFLNNNYEVVGEGDFAHVYVVNSCSVTGISDRKTRQFIRKTKKLNPAAVTAVIGCYAETGTNKISEIEEVDVVLGTAYKSQVYEIVEDILNKHDAKIIKAGGISDLSEYDDYGLVTGMDSRTRAYIKIEDGCDRFCSYCIIPHARGPVRSRPVESVLNEARLLINKGYKELIITGINAALYGKDFESNNQTDNIDLIGLLKKITEIPGDFRIRLSSLEPTVINADYVKELVEVKRLCPHLHLSLQSGSDNILKSMGRKYNSKEYLDIINVLKSYDSNFSVTTDIIVGYPGETDEDFAQSLNMVEEAGFSKVHVFKYSKRDGTPAAKMKNQVPGEIKNKRSQLLIDAAKKESDNFIKNNINTTREALVLEYDKKSSRYKAITDNDIEILVKSNEDITNTFINSKL